MIAPTGRTVIAQLLDEHRDGDVGDEISVRVDQVLLQDTTGGTVMLALDAMGLDRVVPDVAVQYIDHQIDGRSEDPEYARLVEQSHRWLRSACERFGLWFSPPGTGISHLLHLERFTTPGCLLIGSDSHTCMAGAIGALGLGAGGLDVAMVLAGETTPLRVPEVLGVRLDGALRPGVTAKDVGLELLRRLGVDGASGVAIEYHGPGVATLSVMERLAIAGIGTETGALTSVFPTDDVTAAFLAHHGRAESMRDVRAEPGAIYDRELTIDLSTIEPLIAMPSSPGNVVPVHEVAGTPIVQAYLGSSGNMDEREHRVAFRLLAGRRVAAGVRLDVNLPSARIAQALEDAGLSAHVDAAGGVVRSVGCDEFNREEQAPPPGELSLRTTNRNYPGRSGTPGDRVALVSALTAAVSAVTGVVTDPRERLTEEDLVESRVVTPGPSVDRASLAIVAPSNPATARVTTLERGDNIVALPVFEPLPEELTLVVGVVASDDVSTDEILPGGPAVQRYRTNLPMISDALFRDVDTEYVDRARAVQRVADGHAIVAGRNYGQGSSREHAALGPAHLGLRLVLARSVARIHRRNLVNVGVIPARWSSTVTLRVGQRLRVRGLRDWVASDGTGALAIEVEGSHVPVMVHHDLTVRERELLLDGGALAHRRLASR